VDGCAPLPRCSVSWRPSPCHCRDMLRLSTPPTFTCRYTERLPLPTGNVDGMSVLPYWTAQYHRVRTPTTAVTPAGTYGTDATFPTPQHSPTRLPLAGGYADLRGTACVHTVDCGTPCRIILPPAHCRVLLDAWRSGVPTTACRTAGWTDTVGRDGPRWTNDSWFATPGPLDSGANGSTPTFYRGVPFPGLPGFTLPPTPCWVGTARRLGMQSCWILDV